MVPLLLSITVRMKRLGELLFFVDSEPSVSCFTTYLLKRFEAKRWSLSQLTCKIAR